VRGTALGIALPAHFGPAGEDAAVLARGAHLALPAAAPDQRAAHLATIDAEAERGGLHALQLMGLVAAQVAERMVDRDDASARVRDHEAFARLVEDGRRELQLVERRAMARHVAAFHEQAGAPARTRHGANAQLEHQHTLAPARDGELVDDRRAAERLRQRGPQRDGLASVEPERREVRQAHPGDIARGHAQPAAARRVEVSHDAVAIEHAHEVGTLLDQAIRQAMPGGGAACAQRLRSERGREGEHRHGREPECPARQGHHAGAFGSPGQGRGAGAGRPSSGAVGGRHDTRDARDARAHRTGVCRQGRGNRDVDRASHGEILTAG